MPGVILFLLCARKNRPWEAKKKKIRGSHYSFIRIDDLSVKKKYPSLASLMIYNCCPSYEAASQNILIRLCTMT